MDYKVNLLSDKYHQVLLGRNPIEYPKYKLIQHAQGWEQFGLMGSKDTNSEVPLPLPQGFGHWQDMIDQAVKPHLHLLGKLKSITNWKPVLPSNFRCPTGWSYWDNKDTWKKCNPPMNRVMVLDFEAVNISAPGEVPKWVPVCATALLEGTWLTWRADLDNISTTVPFGKRNLIHGWNIPYDRQYLDVEYLQAESGNRFSDGMSQWIVTRGTTNQQKPAWLAHQKEADHPQWVEETTGASLDAVYNFYYKTGVDKAVRTEMYQGGLEYYRNNVLTVLEYCAKDVMATWEVHTRLYPEYLQHRPSLVSQVAALMLGSVWLPMSATRYPGFYDRVEGQYQATKLEIQQELYQLSKIFLDNCLEKYPLPPSTKPKELGLKNLSDWLLTLPLAWQSLDWEPATVGKNKGIPKWFRDLKVSKISVHQRWVPIVLGLCWHGHPVFWDGKGWVTELGAIEHPEDKQAQCTDLFIKGFTSAFEEGVISGSEVAKGLLAKATSTINWVSMRKRVSVIHSETFEGFPVVLPQISPNGTVTGRCADSLWQVLANPKPKRLGTELKSMVEAPTGYSIVGGDIDS